ncbi:E1 protein [Bos taurus papillomavirus 19]|uniref:Replication protein E1 n=1 Tax=Bos taurus papillomavirus 19 TaxID=1887217 RepID=A0A1B2K268_9PAPI|nr:E1 protein [Bos taurus papillomavirus 19]ANZ90252.1 E1 protein [Bos taurus papillomavirus 19]
MGDAENTESEGADGWYFVHEAECSDVLSDFENLFESTTSSDISDLIDNSDVPDQGNSLALFNSKLLEDDERCLLSVKRKYFSPKKQDVLALSPRLEAVHISPGTRQSKRRLFENSGVENEVEDNAKQVAAESQPQVDLSVDLSLEDSGFVGTPAVTTNIVEQLLRSKNQKACLLAKFKDIFGVSFVDLTRTFKSDKSCCSSWMVCTFGVNEDLMQGSKTLLEAHCDYFQMIIHYTEMGVVCLYACEFKTAKARDTVCRLFTTMLNLNVISVLSDPPRTKSLPVALFLFKKALVNGNFKYGDFPGWISSQTLISHQSATAETFQLAVMIQWAKDNDYVEEPEIAFNYAAIADSDPNAAAWQRSNQQVKYVRDCSQMVRLYKRHELRQMSIAAWIEKCCSKIEGTGDWRQIAQFLRYQDVNFVSFLTSFKEFLHGRPKKNCLVIWGESDTGKSLFCSSLIKFMKGRVINFMNSGSHFWLSPLTDAKMGFLDDATTSAWKFMDTYMRNALDGNPICMDLKHKNPVQCRLPPLLVTTNVNIQADMSFKYLHSRLTCLHFPKLFPFQPDGTPVYQLTDENWKSFFKKLQTHLDLVPPEDGESSGTLRQSPGTTPGTL